jgi:hypothetical protein
MGLRTDGVSFEPLVMKLVLLNLGLRKAFWKFDYIKIDNIKIIIVYSE